MSFGFIRSSILALVFTTSLSVAPVCSRAAEPPPANSRPKLYDSAADGNAQIAEALKTAKAEDKRIILKLGANW